MGMEREKSLVSVSQPSARGIQSAGKYDRKSRRPGAFWAVLLVVGGIGLTVGASLIWPHLNSVAKPHAQEVTACEGKTIRSSDASESGDESGGARVADAVSGPLVFDLSRPVPGSVNALIAEVKQVCADLTRSFPHNPDAVEIQARLQEMLGNFKRADAIRKRCIREYPKYAYGYLGLAQSAARQGDYERAWHWAERGLDVSPQMEQLKAMAATALLNLGRPRKVVALLGKSPDGRLRLLLGRALLQLQEYDHARRVLQTALDDAPNDGEVMYALSRAYAGLAQRDKAKLLFDKYRSILMSIRTRGVLRKSKTDDLQSMLAAAAVIDTFAGRVCAAEQQRIAAEQLWRRAAAFNPKNAAPIAELARLYQVTGRWKEALSQLQVLVELQGDRPELYLKMGDVYAAMNDSAAAETCFRKAYWLAPHHGKCLEALAVYYVRVKRHFAEAAHLAQELVEIEPTPARYALLATASFNAGDQTTALQAIQHAVSLEPNNPKYRRMLLAIQQRRTK